MYTYIILERKYTYTNCCSTKCVIFFKDNCSINNPFLSLIELENLFRSEKYWKIYSQAITYQSNE